MGGDGRGEGAAGPVRVAGGMARAACLVELLAVEQHVDDIGRVEVAALDDDGPWSQVVQAARRLAGLRLGAHRPTRQCLRLRRVGGHDRGQWQQIPDQDGDGVLGEQAVEALGDHHGVDDQRAGSAIPEHAGDRLDDLGSAQHPGLDGARADVLEHGHDLRHDHRASDTMATSRTPVVFWAVMAVRALVPKTPSAANVFRSAWMPAPPPESLPAIVRAVGMGNCRISQVQDFTPLPASDTSGDRPPDRMVV